MEQQYIDIYNQYSAVIKQHGAKALNEKRDAAFLAFRQMGFPTRKSENYRYTDLRERFAPDYGLNLNRLESPIDPYKTFQCDVPDMNSHLYFVVNDSFYQTGKNSNPELEKLTEKGVLAGSLKKYAESHPQLITAFLGKSSDCEWDSTVALNEMFAQDGFFLYVPENVIIEKPIQLINVMQANAPLMANSRNLIILGKGAKAKVLVCAHALNPVQFLSNRVTEVFVGENAVYEHYKLESTHNRMTNIGSLFIEQETSSNVLVNEITLQNGFTRNNIRVNLNGEHGETLLCGMAVGDKKQHIDNNTVVNHLTANCKSKELYKYILDDCATGVFSGKVLVAKNARKTAAFQNNKNICLSADAKMYSKPQLEIYADDVKCSHGATTGQIDENALFYLRSRGISEKEARMLLMLAFTNDVIENIRMDALRDRIRHLTENRLRGEMPKCAGCVICRT
ncbi:MAG: Fe-S cluster assembly protein SufD [Prevotellaceae bacterium]|jgi:Fe-S cluster assembly protein SufD|nr:Fe-S cluster assembly protein SufD [Prevotellaceae bacterium]